MFRLKLFNQFLLTAGLVLLLASSHTQAANKQQILKKLKLPKGFTITLFADNVPDARTMALGKDGTIFVGSRNNGSVYALQDVDKDGRAEQRYIIASGLNLPNGVAYKDGTLYVAEIDRIIRFDNIDQQLQDPP